MNNFPAMTEAQRQQKVHWLEEGIACRDEYGFSGNVLKSMQIALAALTADTSKLAELAAKVRKVREDAADFDGDRRGMWEYQEEQEQLLLEEAVKYTAPATQLLRPVELPEPYDDGHGNLWLPQDAVISAVKNAGGEVKS